MGDAILRAGAGKKLKEYEKHCKKRYENAIQRRAAKSRNTLISTVINE
jgi:hypothetical protein